MHEHVSNAFHIRNVREDGSNDNKTNHSYYDYYLHSHQHNFRSTEGHPLVIVKGQTAAGTMAAKEPVFQVHAGFTDQVIRAHKIMVKDEQRELGLQRKGQGQFKHSAERSK